jgi:hypothetical protein
MSCSAWEEQPDGSRVRYVNGIQIVDRTGRPRGGAVEHLVAWQEGGRTFVLALDARCRALSVESL